MAPEGGAHDNEITDPEGLVRRPRALDQQPALTGERGDRARPFKEDPGRAGCRSVACCSALGRGRQDGEVASPEAPPLTPARRRANLSQRQTRGRGDGPGALPASRRPKSRLARGGWKSRPASRAGRSAGRGRCRWGGLGVAGTLRRYLDGGGGLDDARARPHFLEVEAMSRGNRRKPGARHDTWPSSRFSPASDPGPEVALPLTDVFSDLELEFFRQGRRSRPGAPRRERARRRPGMGAGSRRVSTRRLRSDHTRRRRRRRVRPSALARVSSSAELPRSACCPGGRLHWQPGGTDSDLRHDRLGDRGSRRGGGCGRWRRGRRWGRRAASGSW